MTDERGDVSVGMSVNDRGGSSAGIVRRVRPSGFWVEAESGQDSFIPMTVVHAVDGNLVTLNLSAVQLAELRESQLPTAPPRPRTLQEELLDELLP